MGKIIKPPITKFLIYQILFLSSYTEAMLEKILQLSTFMQAIIHYDYNINSSNN